MLRVARPLKAYVLGPGAIGTLVAHDLKKEFKEMLDVTLLCRLNAIHDGNLNLVRYQRGNIERSTEIASLMYPSSNQLKLSTFEIENMLITTKTYITPLALEPYLRALNEDSNVLLLQNGMGVVEMLDEMWIGKRPNLYQAITTHGAYKQGKEVVHSAQGTITIAKLPKPGMYGMERDTDEEIPDFINMILNTKSLRARMVPYEKFLVLQAEKFVANCCINPLTAIFDVNNGSLLYTDHIVKIMRSIIKEAVLVLNAEFEELRNSSEAQILLNQDRLLSNVIALCKDTEANSSSMRQDIRQLKEPELRSLNSQVVEWGYKHRIGTPANRMIAQIVTAKLDLHKALDRKSSDEALEI